MSVIFYIYIFLLIISLIDCVLISTPQGYIRGTTKATLNGCKIYSFLGIPYAKPPVNELRFKNPEPFGSWYGVRVAMRDGPQCIQPDVISQSDSDDPANHMKIDNMKTSTPKVVGSEDCLYLNVHTPGLEESKKYPVIVFMHGGGFVGGSGLNIFYGPDYLLDKDVVLVTINYRIGALGFASTEDAEMSGNWGLKDQTLAFKWIQENISAYGGNPDSVTIMGQSAGAASVDYHLISPLSEGLFHRAIAMSGSATCPWAIKSPGEIAKRTKKLASYLQCPTEPTGSLLECLKKIPPERFIEMHHKFLVWDVDPIVVFSPVVEPTGLDGAFLTENPYTSKRRVVPALIGVTKEEGGMRVGMLKSSNLDELLSELDENFLKYGPPTLGYDNEDEDKTEFVKEVRKFYFGDKRISKDDIKAVIDMYSDSWFVECTISLIRRLDSPSYLYLFSYEGEHSFAKTIYGEDGGVYHGDDLLYLFPPEFLQDGRNITKDDWKMIDTMVTLWTNFAIYGNPTPEGSELVWDQVSKSEMNYMNLDVKNLGMKQHFQEKRDNFWQKLLQKQPPSTSSLKSEL